MKVKVLKQAIDYYDEWLQSLPGGQSIMPGQVIPSLIPSGDSRPWYETPYYQAANEVLMRLGRRGIRSSHVEQWINQVRRAEHQPVLTEPDKDGLQLVVEKLGIRSAKSAQVFLQKMETDLTALALYPDDERRIDEAECPVCHQAMERAVTALVYPEFLNSDDTNLELLCDGCRSPLSQADYKKGAMVVYQQAIRHCSGCKTDLCAQCANHPLTCGARGCNAPMSLISAAQLPAKYPGCQFAKCDGCGRSIVQFTNREMNGQSVWHCNRGGGHDLCRGCMMGQRGMVSTSYCPHPEHHNQRCIPGYGRQGEPCIRCQQPLRAEERVDICPNHYFFETLNKYEDGHGHPQCMMRRH